jgi:hypothetical protein
VLLQVAVIDGVNVLYTPFRRVVVPPPMSHYTLATMAAVDYVTFGPLQTLPEPQLQALALLRTGDVLLHTLDGTSAVTLGTCNLKQALGLAEVSLVVYMCSLWWGTCVLSCCKSRVDCRLFFGVAQTAAPRHAAC